MSRIRSRDTKPEMLVRKYLHQKGFRFRLSVRTLPGKPDVVLPKYETVVFVHGCFWHGHRRCKYFVVPKTRKSWWLRKIDRNRENDRKHARELRKRGWKVLVVYECQLRGTNKATNLKKLEAEILSQ